MKKMKFLMGALLMMLAIASCSKKDHIPSVQPESSNTENSLAGITAEVLVIGYVKDGSDHTPLPGAKVMVKSTNVGTLTNSDGYYQLVAPGNGEVIVVSSVGYQTQEKPITGLLLNFELMEVMEGRP